MKTALVIAWVFTALLLASDGKATAQVVIGGSGKSDVQVNRQVLKALGPPPNLAGLLGGSTAPASPPPQFAPVQVDASAAAPQTPPEEGGGIVFHRYAPPRRPVPARHRQAAVHRAVAVKAAPAVIEHHAQPVKTPARIETPAVKVAEAKRPSPVAKPSKPEAMPAPEAKKQTAPKPKPPAAVVVSKPAPAKPVPAKAAEADTAPAPASAQIFAKIETQNPAPVATIVAKAPPVVEQKGDTLSVMFTADGTNVPAGAYDALDALAARMKKNQDISLQILGYAEGSANDVSRARRLSLSRALEVRRYLMKQGISSTRMDIRALGNMLEGGGPPNRVDAVLTAR